MRGTVRSEQHLDLLEEVLRDIRRKERMTDEVKREVEKARTRQGQSWRQVVASYQVGVQD